MEYFFRFVFISRHFNGTLKNTLTVTAGLGGMGGAQPLAVTMNEGVNITVEIDPIRIKKRLKTRYLDISTDSYTDAIDKAKKSSRYGL